MRTAIVAGAAALLAVLPARAADDTKEEAKGVREGAATTSPTDAEALPSFVPVAQEVQKSASAEEVEKLVREHGLPAPKTSFRWCNAAGCVDRGNEEVGSTWMTASWLGRDTMSIVFCRQWGRPDGVWRVAGVRVAAKSKPGAFGTRVAGEELFQLYDHETMRRCRSGR